MITSIMAVVVTVDRQVQGVHWHREVRQLLQCVLLQIIRLDRLQDRLRTIDQRLTRTLDKNFKGLINV